MNYNCTKITIVSEETEVVYSISRRLKYMYTKVSRLEIDLIFILYSC